MVYVVDFDFEIASYKQVSELTVSTTINFDMYIYRMPINDQTQM